MHNKMFVADNQLAIVGGRNIGNEYFGLKAKYNFRDLDVLTVGPVVNEISRAFDRYWNAESAYPGGAMSTKVAQEDLQKLMAMVTAQLERDRNDLKSFALEPQSWNRQLTQLPDQLKPGEAHFMQDQPIVENGEELRLVEMLGNLAAPSHEELIILTPYLIPVGDFLKDLARLETEGVQVKILTGSLGSNNHTVTHSHYRKYRHRILETGAELYEFRHDPSVAVMIGVGKGRPSPPSEPCKRFSRTRLSSRWLPHRDRRANMWALRMVKSPRSAKKEFGHSL